ncbi:hypothetical protein QQ045_013159 [Rhodiola kirilowii]
MPHQKAASSSKYLFRFTQDEVAEMENLLEENNNASPSTKVFNALAIKFSKTRHQQGQSYVHYDSVRNWFRKRRHVINKKRKALSVVKSSKPSDPCSAAEIEQSEQSPIPCVDEMKSDDEEASSKSSSEVGTFGEPTSGRHVPSSSVMNSVEIVNDTDVSQRPMPFLQHHVSEVDSVLARLAKFKRVQPEANPKTCLSLHSETTPSSGVNALDMVHKARATLEKLKGISLVDFKSYRRDFDGAINIIVEKGFLSDTEKTELLLLQERILKIVNENVQSREELSKCNAFREKLTDATESAYKLVKTANLLEEKYNKIPQEMLAVSRKIAELEATLVQANTELEIMKGDWNDVANKLCELSESLESANKHYMSLKAEETSMIEKQANTEERLGNNIEEWVQLTHSREFAEHGMGQ